MNKDTFEEFKIFIENKRALDLEQSPEKMPNFNLTPIQQRKKDLAELSDFAKYKRDLKVVELINEDDIKNKDKIETLQLYTVNQCLLNFCYDGLEFHTYKKWLELNFQVKKGSKAVLFWSKPIDKKKEKKPDANGDKQEVKLNNEIDYSFYNIAFTFSELQVEKID